MIPEKIAIRLINSSEVTAEQFYRHILEQYRILNQLQQQRQQFLQKQHIQLQQMAAGNKFQEIFATATIIQSNPKDRINKPVTPTNGTFLLDPARQPPPPPLIEPDRIPLGIEEQESTDLRPVETLPILDTAPVIYGKRKTHRKHYQHHRRNQRNHQKKEMLEEPSVLGLGGVAEIPEVEKVTEEKYKEAALNPPTSIVQEPVYTSIPIPLILNSKEDKRPYHSHGHSHGHVEKRTKALARKRITAPSVSGYETKSYLNPFLNGELIFEK